MDKLIDIFKVVYLIRVFKCSFIKQYFYKNILNISINTPQESGRLQVI